MPGAVSLWIALQNDFRNSLWKWVSQNRMPLGWVPDLALAGKNVFVCGPACFYSARTLEQVKVDVAYSGTNVKIIGVSGGVSYGALGQPTTASMILL